MVRVLTSFFGRLRPSRPIAEPRSRITYFGAVCLGLRRRLEIFPLHFADRAADLPSPTTGSARSRVASAVRNAG